MSMARVPLALRKLRDDEQPLAVAGAWARDRAAAALVDALLALADATLRTMRAAIVRDSASSPSSPLSRAWDGALVVVIGPAIALPWRDGVRYLGEPAPGLFIPTTRGLTVPAVAAAQALAKHAPCALLDDVLAPEARPELISLRSALSLSRAAIRRGLARGNESAPPGEVA